MQDQISTPQNTSPQSLAELKLRYDALQAEKKKTSDIQIQARTRLEASEKAEAELMGRLSSEYGVSSLEEAKALRDAETQKLSELISNVENTLRGASG